MKKESTSFRAWAGRASSMLILLLATFAGMQACGPAFADTMGTAPVLLACRNFSVVEAHNHLSSRQYRLTGKCEVTKTGIIASDIKATFHKSSNLAQEVISVPGIPGPILVNYQCNEDPWLVPAASCSKTGSNTLVEGGGGPLLVYLGFDVYKEPPLPVSRAAVTAVKQYIQGLLAPLPPRIVQPYANHSYVYPDKEHLPIVVDYAGVLEQQGANGWYEYFQYPEGAETVELRWEYLGTSPGPDLKKRIKIWKPVNVVTNVKIGYPPVVNLVGIEEGKYRVKARHKVSGFPWTEKWRELWVGDPVDYGKPSVTIWKPENNAVIEPGSAETLIPVSIQVRHHEGSQGGTVPPPPTYKRTPVEVQLMLLAKGDGGYQWGPDTGTVSYSTNEWETLTPYLDAGIWRIRARIRSAENETAQAPWTSWRMFIAGSPNNIPLRFPPLHKAQPNLDSDSFKKIKKLLEAAKETQGKADIAGVSKAGPMTPKTDAAKAKIGALQAPVQARLGARLMLKDHNIVTTLSKKAGEAFDLVFPVTNVGEAASGPSAYSINCMALLGGPCSSLLSNKTGNLPGIEARRGDEIKLERLEFPVGEYEVSVTLQPGMVKKVRLKVTTMIQPKAAPAIQQKEDGKPTIQQIHPSVPKPEPSPQDGEKSRLRGIPK